MANRNKKTVNNHTVDQTLNHSENIAEDLAKGNAANAIDGMNSNPTAEIPVNPLSEEELLLKASKDAEKAGKIVRFGGKALKVAAAMIAVATVVDVLHDVNEGHEQRMESAREERELHKQMGKDQRKYKDLGYDYETYQEVVKNASQGRKVKHDPVLNMLQYDNVVQDMYADREGHTKMGNSRFYR